jgi:hypothetical protein
LWNSFGRIFSSRILVLYLGKNSFGPKPQHEIDSRSVANARGNAAVAICRSVAQQSRRWRKQEPVHIE